MKELQMPASYGRIPEAEQFQIVGGGELADAWNDFTDRLRLDDLFFSGGVLSLSFSFVPMLLFHVFRSAYNFAENTYNNLVNWFGFHDDTLSALQSYTTICARSARSAGSEPSQPPSTSVHPC